MRLPPRELPEELDRVAAVADLLGDRREGLGEPLVQAARSALGTLVSSAGVSKRLVPPRPHLIDSIARLTVEERTELLAVDVVAGGLHHRSFR